IEMNRSAKFDFSRTASFVAVLLVLILAWTAPIAAPPAQTSESGIGAASEMQKVLPFELKEDLRNLRQVSGSPGARKPYRPRLIGPPSRKVGGAPVEANAIS